MDYGKTAYLKILDLEKEISLSKTENSHNSYLEISKPNINELITNLSSVKVHTPPIDVESGKTICFQIVANFTSTNQTQIKCNIIINQSIIHEETKILNDGENDFVIFKTFTPLSTQTINPYLEFFTEDEQPLITLKSVKIIVLGAKNTALHTDIELKAIPLEKENSALISYIDDNKLYYSIQQQTVKNVPKESFSYLTPAISHCFTQEFYTTDNILPEIVLYRVDTGGNLYHSKPFNNLTETFIDSNVTSIHACPSPIISGENNIAVYIKNGDCYYFSSKNGHFTKPKKLNLPEGKYVDIQIVSHIESDNVFVFASHENGSNYVLSSNVNVSTTNLNEHLKLSYDICVAKYIDVASYIKESNEKLKLDLTSAVSSFIDYNSLFKRVSKSNLNLSYSLKPTSYKIEFDAVYGVKLDKHILTAGEWESYTDDAVNFDGAYMDFENDTFVDNGWLNRWPYNEIRPCILKDGQVIGYLNPNNYSLFEDGTPANIYNHTYGDVMIEIPKIYYKLSTDDNYIYVQISKKPKEGFTDRAFWHNGHDNDKIYVAAYLAGDVYIRDYGFYSNSDTLLNNYYSISYTNFYAYKQKFNSPNMEFLPFNVLTLLQCLYIIMFKNTDSQNSLGMGRGSIKSSYRTGNANDKGMYYGKNQTDSALKCFGMEDLYGVRMTIVTGFYVDSAGYPRFIDVYDPNSSYDPTNVASYIGLENPFIISNTRTGTLTTITGHNELGFVDKVNTTISNATLGFTDHCFTLKNTSSMVFGIVRTGGDYGIFNTKTVRASDFDQLWNIRLVYYPNLNK